VQYLPLYSAAHRARHLVPPGLTGNAQVSGRNSLSWAERFDLDVAYIRRNSVVEDLRIIFRTVAIVLRREGISAAGEATMPAFDGYGPRAVRQSHAPLPAIGDAALASRTPNPPQRLE